MKAGRRSTVGCGRRNYYEHIIRNEAALDRLRQYIADNPAHAHDGYDDVDVLSIATYEP